MSESLSPLPASPQRRIIATVIAIVVMVIMAIAFFSGGSAETEPVKEDNLADTPLNLDEEYGTHNPGEAINPEDWINVATGNLAQTPSSSETSTGPAMSQSSVVAGDQPSASSNNQPQTQTAAATPQTAAATPQTAAATPQTAAATPQTAAATPQTAAATPQTAAATPQTAAATPQTAAATPQTVAATPQKVVTTSKSESSAPQTTAAPIQQTTKPQVSAQSSESNVEPVFVKPSVQRSGLIAQSKGLITEPQIRRNQTNQPTDKPATAPKSPSLPAPAKVRQQEARQFAQQTTYNMRKQGLLKPEQKVRLPKLAESNNPRIWREDETPASADERRPFGLIVVDENPATTPEGIPLRTDIPAGASALQKTGPDKPLWKRPE